LKALVNGGWKESSKGAIDWTAYDDQTIAHFLEYLYRGDYGIFRYSVPSKAQNGGQKTARFFEGNQLLSIYKAQHC
jgi:hypothetical protein